ncbi:MAG: hypothetical protein EXR99_15600 [Gemmataceae bacterium]|nr:hypothetical protein [Gemmataceae bacterium]
MKPQLTQNQKGTILEGVHCGIILLVILQFWLLTATMNAWLGGEASVAVAAFMASGLCLLGNHWLLGKTLIHFDKD